MTKSDEEIVEAMLIAANDVANDDTDPALVMLAAYRVARAHVLDEAAARCRKMGVIADGHNCSDAILALKDRTS